MAGRAGLKPKLAALAALVVIAHGVAVEWIGANLVPLDSPLKKMAPPLYTRVLQPAEPPATPLPPAAAPPRQVAPQAARAPAVPASAPRPEDTAAEAEPAPAPSGLETVAPPMPTGPPEPAVAAAPAPSAQSTPAEAPKLGVDAWPTDTRLNYRLGGRFRNGELYGSAKVQWQREDSKYEVRLEADVTLFASIVMTSQGEVKPGGLMPRVYEEVRPGRRRVARLDDSTVFFESGKTQPRPAGIQDTASQFVDLGQRFARGEVRLEVGRTVDVWLARPNNVDLWTYDVVALEKVQTPNLGAVEAFHLKPRPIANPRGNINVEMWFAPSLQYLPVRVKINMGENDYLDLVVETIQQK